MKKPKEYKLINNVPIIRRVVWDADLPEYVAMKKAKVGQCFEFPKARLGYVVKSRVQLRKENPNLSFVITTEATMKKLKMENGRCWRDRDGAFANRTGPKKKRPLKPTAGDL